MYRQNETLASFLPRWHLDLLAARPGLPEAPAATTTEGAVLFVDVSGFTGLTSDFARHGHRGAEQLSRVIDGIFGPVTDIVSSHGGDIFIFAGDAALAVWPVGGGETLADVTTRAAGAARVIQSRRFQTDDNAPVRLRATVGAGELRALELGGVDRQWLFMIDGDALSQVVRSDAVAEPGTVTVSLPAWSLLRDRASASAIDTVAMRLEQLDHPPQAAGEFRAVPALDAGVWPSVVPSVVCQRIPEGHGDWLAEFRTVSVVVMNLQHDRSDVAQLDKLVRCMQESVLHFEGQVYQCLVDDKGANLLAAFGLPPKAHEDDAERSLMAALNTQSRLRALGLESSIGVATGMLWCGLYGSRERRQYSIVGPAVNLASRLMQQSDGRILCDPATAAASRSIVCREVGEVAVKGYDAPVRTLQAIDVASLTSVRSTSGAFIGRKAELGIIADATATLLERREGSFLLIEGDAGLGKSTLVDRAVDQFPAELHCLTGTCEAAHALRPYAAWMTVLRELLGLSPDDITTDPVPGRIVETLGLEPGREALAPLLNVALQTAFPENEATEGMTSELRATRTRALLKDLVVEAAGRQPLALVLEGGHLFDSHSWSLLQTIVGADAPILTILSSRPVDARPSGIDELLASPPHRRILLGPLSGDESQDLIRELLDVDAVPEEITHLAVERATGHPLFTEQLIFALRETGVFDVIDGRCVLLGQARDREQAARSVSLTLAGVVLGRADRLSPSQQLTLRTASVIGMRFSSPQLAAVHPDERRGTLPDDLETLVERRFLRRIEGESGSYAFENVLIRDVMYESIPFAQRRENHLAVARWFENAGFAERASHWPVLGHHYRHADITHEAARYFDKAGTHALGEHANAEAVRYIGEALELVAEDASSTYGELRVKHGLANVAWSRYDDGRRSLESGLEALDRRLPQSSAGAAASSLAELAAQLLGRRTASATDDTDARQLRLRISRGYEGLVEAYFIDGRKMDCLYCAVRALNVAEKAGPSAELARGYATMSALFGMMHLEGIAEKYKARALDTAAAVNDAEARAWSLLSVGIYKLGNADWADAEACLTEAAVLSADIRHIRREYDCRISLSNLYLLRGLFDRVNEELERCEALTRISRDARAAAAIVRNRVLTFAFRNDADELGRLQPRLQSIFDPDLGLIESEVEVSYALRALASLYEDRILEAKEYADRALEAVALRGTDTYVFAFDFTVLARVYLEQDEVDLDRLALLETTARAHARIFPLGKPVSRWISGRLHILKNRARRARKHLEKCASNSVELDMPYYAALGHIELAQLASTTGDSEAHLETASEHLASLGLEMHHVRT